MNIFTRSFNLLSTKIYKKADTELLQMKFNSSVGAPDDQYILRMMVKSPDTMGALAIPSEIKWLENIIKDLELLHSSTFRPTPFIYVTVRNGLVRSSTDDEWHVDGFSMRTPHYPEMNFIWSDKYPTQYLDQNFSIPEDFDPTKHNIHQFFQDRADKSKIKTADAGSIIFMDPYIVHRRDPMSAGKKRKFFRISFVPIEIEDDSCTPNPLLKPKHYGREDIRKRLIRYEQ